MFSCGWPSRVATEQLAVADDALALRADVDEDLVLVDADDLALDDVAVLEALDVGVLLGEQLLHRRRLGAEVARRGSGSARLGARRPSAGVSSAAGASARLEGCGGRVGRVDGWPRARRRSRLPRRPRRRGRRVGVGGVGGGASGGRGSGSAAGASVGAAAASTSVPSTSTSVAVTASAVSVASISADAVGVVVGLGGLVGDGDRRARSARTPGRRRRRWPPAPARSRPAASSVNVLVTPGRGFAPENHERPERRSSRVRRRSRWSVVIVAPRSAPSCSNGLMSLFSCPASRGRESLAHALLDGYNRRAVPELPDLTVVADALHAALAGRPIAVAEAPGPARRAGHARRARGARRPAASSASARRGKFLLIDLDRDRIVVNPMLTGRFQLAAPGDEAADQDRGRARVRAARRRRRADAAAWTRGRRLAAGRRRARRRSAIATRPRWARSTCVPAGVDRPVPGLGTRRRARTPTTRR